MDSANNQTAKNIQLRNLALIGSIFAILIGIIFYLLNAKSTKIKPEKPQEIHFAKTMHEPEIYAAALENFQNKISDTENKSSQLKEQINNLEKNLQNRNQNQYQDLLEKIKSLESQLSEVKQSPQHSQNFKPNYRPANLPDIPEDNSLNAQAPTPGFSMDGNDNLNLVNLKNKLENLEDKSAKNPETYVPAGTHVLGVLLQGADLVANQNNQQNPKPILIRLIRNGTLPNQRESNLEGCIITAAMTGDISSGRGDVRLERLSCVRENNSIIDVAVFGTASTNAKEGIVGQTYTREGKRLINATSAGILAGVANGVSSSYVQYQNSIFGPVGEVNNSDLLKYGALQGAATGLDKLADFQMSRADAIYPIIQVNGGKLVNVVFLQGFYFNGGI